MTASLKLAEETSPESNSDTRRALRLVPASVVSGNNAMLRIVSSLMLLLVVVTAVGAAELTPQQEEFFETKIRPVLADQCWKCHGATKQESDLRLDSSAAMIRGGASGEQLVSADNAGQSLLLKAVKHEGEVKMPPEQKLSDEQIAALSDWVSQGAFWPQSAAEPTSLTAAERVAVHRQQHWAYQPVVSPALPAVQNRTWPQNGIDHFILARLESQNLTPSPAADRRTLLRRLSFDLVGLPPSMEEVEAFANDHSPDAYEKVVDRLLASPQYGERWGRHWLDVARYADTMGYAFERDRRYPYAYTYRDYVIDALNRDLPYDRFIKEQLAADELDLGGDLRPLAALGFITVGRKFLAVQDVWDDQVDVVTRGLMGLTVACARCHDHKYDAIPTEDYYSLFGVFANCSQPDPENLPIIGEPSQVAGYQEFEKELKRLQGEVDNYINERHAEIQTTARTQATDYLVRVASRDAKDDWLAKLSFLTLKPQDIRRKLVERWQEYVKQRAAPEHAIWGAWSQLVALAEPDFAEKSQPVLEALLARPEGYSPNQIHPQLLAALKATPPQSRAEVAKIYGQLLATAYEAWKAAGANDEALNKLEEDTKQFANIVVGQDAPSTIPRDKIRDYVNRAERDRLRKIEDGVKTHQANSSAAPPRAMIVKERDRPENTHVLVRGNVNRPGKQVQRQFPVVLAGSERQPFVKKAGRLELAEQVASPLNPLTRRVIVNRLWMHHFGEPLVDTPSDFGIRTAKPIHAELLDYLAAELLRENWSLKALHRSMVLSAAYQQSSVDRPECREIDPENRLLWKMNRQRLEWEALRDSMLAAANRLDAAQGGRAVELTKAPFPQRRTVYGYLDRQDLPNLFRVFDIASPDQSASRRPRTTIPQQSLYLMNSPFAIEQGQALANRQEVVASADLDSQVVALFRAALAREPNPGELAASRAFLETTAADPQEAKLSPREQFAQLLLMMSEFAYVD